MDTSLFCVSAFIFVRDLVVSIGKCDYSSFNLRMRSVRQLLVFPIRNHLRAVTTSAPIHQTSAAQKFDPDHTRTEVEETSTRFEQLAEQTSDNYVYKKIEQKLPDRQPLYLDHQATSPLDPRVLDAMMPYLLTQYGNPHSRSHAYGWQSEQAMEKARTQVAALIGADPKEIVYTSGATESNNLAIKGAARFYKSKKKHIITTQTVSISRFWGRRQFRFVIGIAPICKEGGHKLFIVA